MDSANDEVRKVIEETESDLSETQNLETTMLNLTAAVMPSQIVIFFVDLKASENQELKAIQKKLAFKTMNKMGDNITHVVVSSKIQIAESNVPYYQGLMMGKWIVDFECKFT